MYTRKDYMNRKCTHREYYSQFVSDEIKENVTRYIGKKRILNSDDEHFNTIPLNEWDAIPISLQYNRDWVKAEENGEWLSPAVKVCILKEAAKQIQEGR